MPYAIDSTCGHIDRFVGIMFRSKIDDLDSPSVVATDQLFGRLCRVIALTEKRGYRQVEILLRNSHVRSDARLIKIFRIIERDEPSHWEPYESWLDDHGERRDRWWERNVDRFIHSELLFLKLPILFLNPFLKKQELFADEGELRSPGSS
jgi:hypothetical protein